MKNTFYNETLTKKRLCDFIINSSKLSMSQKCTEFEEKFSKYQGRKYSVLFNSGSSANIATIQALLNLGLINKGDCVGFSALTWATNVMPIMQLGLEPVPVDISIESLNVNLKNLKEAKKKPKVMFITNLLGFCGDLDKIRDYCENNKIILLEDNCESLGSELNGTKLGNFGLASSFSFYVGHHLSTIEGGMVCTDDKKLYEMLLMVRAHGWSRNISKESQEELKLKNQINDFYDEYSFYYLGFNFRPTEITGFLGCEQLSYIEEICKKRNDNFKKFEEAIKSVDVLKLNLKHMNFVCNFAYPIICKNKESFEKYREIFANVEIRPIVGGNMTQQPFFKDNFDCPNAKMVHEFGFYIPNNPDLTEEEVLELCRLIKSIS